MNKSINGMMCLAAMCMMLGCAQPASENENTPAAAPVTVAAPTNVTVADTPVNNEVRITWTDAVSDSVLTYSVYYGKNGTDMTNGTAIRIAENVTSGNVGSKTVLSESGYYYFWVQASDGINTSSNAGGRLNFEYISVTIDKPTGIDVADYTESNTVKVSWDDAGNDKYYFVYYSRENDPSTAVLNKSDDGKDSGVKGFALVELSESGQYYFWIKVADSMYLNISENVSPLSEPAVYQFVYTE